MKNAKQANEGAGEIQISRIDTTTLAVRIIGKTPLIINRVSEKAQRQLLMGTTKKNATEKATTLKHQPLDEFRASIYRLAGDEQPTLIGMPGGAFKRALASAALDIPGAKKAQIGRLTWVEGEYVPIYGKPELLMSITRSADIAKTPDVRTRAILREWACELRITFVSPNLKQGAIVNLLAAAGICIGVGDWRMEKGSGNYGQFEPIGDDNAPAWNKIVKNWGRPAQLKAMADPDCYNDETAELLAWYGVELKRREMKVVDKKEKQAS